MEAGGATKVQQSVNGWLNNTNNTSMLCKMTRYWGSELFHVLRQHCQLRPSDRTTSTRLTASTTSLPFLPRVAWHALDCHVQHQHLSRIFLYWSVTRRKEGSGKVTTLRFESCAQDLWQSKSYPRVASQVWWKRRGNRCKNSRGPFRVCRQPIWRTRTSGITWIQSWSCSKNGTECKISAWHKDLVEEKKLERKL